MKYAVVVEKGENGFSAYVPDLPGCIVAGDSREEVIELIQGAIEMHLEALQSDGQPVPAPEFSVEFVEVAA